MATKAKSSTAASSPEQDPEKSSQTADVLLRPKQGGKSRLFAAEHASNLLAYPNTQWEHAAESGYAPDDTSTSE